MSVANISNNPPKIEAGNSSDDKNVTHPQTTGYVEEDFAEPRESLPHSYTEYVTRLAKTNPTFEWLREFFDYRPEEPDSEVIILDLEQNSFKRRQPDLETLKKQPDTVQLRIVLFCYKSIWRLDRDSLDNICYALDLEPLMVWAHFDHDFSHIGNPFCEDEPQERDGPLSRQLPSTSRYLNICTILEDLYYSLLVSFIEGPQGRSQTVVLFSNEPGNSYARHFPLWRYRSSIHQSWKCPDNSQDARSLSHQHYLDEIHTWVGTLILADSIKNPIEFAVPLFKIFLNRIAQTIHRGWAEAWYALNPGLEGIWEEKLSAEEEIYYSALMQVRYLTHALSSFQMLCRTHQNGPSAMVDGALMDLENILNEATQLRDAMKDRLGRRAAILALEESRKSIQIANSLKTLTKLAFVFVPLTFGTSIFGANIREFGTGEVPAWTFAVTVACICLATVSLSWIWSKNKNIQWNHIFRSVLRPILLFSLRSPIMASALGLYVLTHWESRSIRRTLRLLAVQDLADSSNRRICNLKAFPQALRKTVFYKAFWPNCLNIVGWYTSEDGWQDDRFWKPWIRRQRQAKSRNGII